MSTLGKRIEALEARAGDGCRIRVVHLQDGETTEQALERVGPAGLDVLGTIAVRHVAPDPERAARMEAGLAVGEMTTEELKRLREALAEG